MAVGSVILLRFPSVSTIKVGGMRERAERGQGGGGWCAAKVWWGRANREKIEQHGMVQEHYNYIYSMIEEEKSMTEPKQERG